MSSPVPTPVALGPPGVEVQWVSADRPLPHARRTDVVGFVGFAARGPAHEPVRLRGWSQFRGAFGDADPRGWLGAAVQGFFANGGDTCWVVRTLDPQRAALAAAMLPGRPGLPAVSATATSYGRWADGTRLVVVPDGDRFNLMIDSSLGREVWPDLGLDRDGARYAPKTVNDESRGSRVVRLGVAPGAAVGAGQVRLAGGADGVASVGTAHLSGEDAPVGARWGLAALDTVVEVAVVVVPDAVPRAAPAAPPPPRPRPPVDCCDPDPCGATRPDASASAPAAERPPGWTAAQSRELQVSLLRSCARHRRFALLDVPDAGTRPDAAIDWAAGLERASGAADHGCLLYPWIRIADPAGRAGDVLDVPTCGHVAGIVARSDRSVGVHKAPANESVIGALDLAHPVEDDLRARLNEAYVDAVAVVPGRGIRLMGARTLSRDPQWRYTNVRRLLSMIELSLETALAWLVFEPNSDALAAEVEREVRTFLHGLWQRGALDGARFSDAADVRCDPSVRTPLDVAAGRLICLVGLQPPVPAEFVTVRLAVSEAGVQVLGEQGRRVAAATGILDG